MVVLRTLNRQRQYRTRRQVLPLELMGILSVHSRNTRHQLLRPHMASSSMGRPMFTVVLLL